MSEARETVHTQAELVELLDRSTTSLDQTIQALTTQEVDEPSGLPGWSRGHLLTHLANNAEGLTRVILGALTSQVLPMYSSADARQGDIAAGATRDGLVIVAHAQLAAATLSSAIRTVSDWDSPTVFHTVTGAVEQPLTEVLRMRLREVAIHHVDLNAGHHFDNEDNDVINELVRDSARRFSPNESHAIDLLVDGKLIAAITGDQASSATSAVDLDGGAMLSWLTGRGPSQSDLPALPPWG